MRLYLCAALSAVILFSSLNSSACFGQDVDSSSKSIKPLLHGREASADLAAIRAGSEAFVAAFNNKDAKTLAACWTDDGDCIDDTGKPFQGRAEIEKVYAEVFKQRPNNRIKIVIDSLRLLSPDAAIEDGYAILDPVPPGPPATQRVTFTVGDNKLEVVETGLYNLTKDEAPALIHFGTDRTEQWLLVRLHDPKASQN